MSQIKEGDIVYWDGENGHVKRGSIGIVIRVFSYYYWVEWELEKGRGNSCIHISYSSPLIKIGEL